MPQNRKSEIQNRRLKVAQMYLQGAYQSVIAKELSVSEGQISQDLKFLRKEWQKDRIAAIDEKIAEELAKIDNLERKNWEGWDKSIKDHKRTTSKVKGQLGSKTPDSREMQETEIIKDGDPRFLQGVQKCIELRCKLLGLDAPIKIKNETSLFLDFLMSTP